MAKKKGKRSRRFRHVVKELEKINRRLDAQEKELLGRRRRKPVRSPFDIFGDEEE